MYLLVTVARGPFTEHSNRLSRVTPAVPLSYCLVAQTGLSYRLKLRFYFSKTFRKGGDYVINNLASFSISINIATAAMEGIYERLCWIYITLKNTRVYDHVGNTYHLSELTELSEVRIPYPEQFANKLDYEQKSLLHDFQMKDVLRTNWIKQGEESLHQIVSIFREECLQQIVLGIYDPNAILKICLNKIFASTIKT